MNAPHTYNQKICYSIDQHLSYMTQHHNKVLFIRFDLRFPQGYAPVIRNDEISRFMKDLKDFSIKEKLDLQYLWAREQVNSPVPHYHIAVWVNGSQTQSPYKVLTEAEKIWNRIVGYVGTGLVHFCHQECWGQTTTGSIMIRRPSGEATGDVLVQQQQMYQAKMQEAQERSMYLAKTYSKGNAPYRVREWQGSQLPK